MTTVRISGGVVHNLPADLRKALAADAKALAAWEDITPLARNEWICWTISVKKDETRRQHVERVCSELKEGMRRSVLLAGLSASMSIPWCDSRSERLFDVTESVLGIGISGESPPNRTFHPWRSKCPYRRQYTQYQPISFGCSQEASGLRV
jgi:hypothetical protein